MNNDHFIQNIKQSILIGKSTNTNMDYKCWKGKKKGLEMLPTVSLQSHSNVHSLSFWSFPPNKTEYLLPTSDKHMKSCLPLAQCWIIDDVLEDIYSLCLPHMYLITTPKLHKEEGAGRFPIFLFPSGSIHCDFHAWNWCSCPFSPFLSWSSSQMYKYTVTWNASWERRSLFSPIKMLWTEEFTDIVMAAD